MRYRKGLRYIIDSVTVSLFAFFHFWFDRWETRTHRTLIVRWSGLSNKSDLLLAQFVPVCGQAAAGHVVVALKSPLIHNNCYTRLLLDNCHNPFHKTRWSHDHLTLRHWSLDHRRSKKNLLPSSNIRASLPKSVLRTYTLTLSRRHTCTYFANNLI